MNLRQIALAAVSLNPYREQLFELLGVDKDYQDPGVAEFGLVNSVMSIGDSFLEIVAPAKENTAVSRTLARRQAPACGYMLLLQVNNFVEFERQIADTKLRKIWQTERDEVSACHIHPKDIGGAIVSFDEMRPPADWLWGGPNWRNQRATNVTRIMGCQMSSPDPDTLAERWSKIMATPLEQKDQHLTLSFSDGTFIQFVSAEQEELHGITFQCEDPQAQYAKAAEIGICFGEQPRIGVLNLDFVA
ncbi:MAG: hypothetical protein GXP16_10490 [Gammaproteobacteria bacterium]|nr:hypothetical protein [Gammaproteobacteria bacterium]